MAEAKLSAGALDEQQSGGFADALLLVVWLEFLLTLAQAAQMLVMFVSPPLATIIAFAALGMFLWLLAQFTAALHGFRDLAFPQPEAGPVSVVSADFDGQHGDDLAIVNWHNWGEVWVFLSKGNLTLWEPSP